MSRTSFVFVMFACYSGLRPTAELRLCPEARDAPELVILPDWRDIQEPNDAHNEPSITLAATAMYFVDNALPEPVRVWNRTFTESPNYYLPPTAVVVRCPSRKPEQLLNASERVGFWWMEIHQAVCPPCPPEPSANP